MPPKRRREEEAGEPDERGRDKKVAFRDAQIGAPNEVWLPSRDLKVQLFLLLKDLCENEAASGDVNGNGDILADLMHLIQKDRVDNAILSLSMRPYFAYVIPMTAQNIGTVRKRLHLLLKVRDAGVLKTPFIVKILSLGDQKLLFFGEKRWATRLRHQSDPRHVQRTLAQVGALVGHMNSLGIALTGELSFDHVFVYNPAPIDPERPQIHTLSEDQKYLPIDLDWFYVLGNADVPEVPVPAANYKVFSSFVVDMLEAKFPGLDSIKSQLEMKGKKDPRSLVYPALSQVDEILKKRYVFPEYLQTGHPQTPLSPFTSQPDVKETGVLIVDYSSAFEAKASSYQDVGCVRLYNAINLFCHLFTNQNPYARRLWIGRIRDEESLVRTFDNFLAIVLKNDTITDPQLMLDVTEAAGLNLDVSSFLNLMPPSLAAKINNRTMPQGWLPFIRTALALTDPLRRNVVQNLLNVVFDPETYSRTQQWYYMFVFAMHLHNYTADGLICHELSRPNIMKHHDLLYSICNVFQITHKVNFATAGCPLCESSRLPTERKIAVVEDDNTHTKNLLYKTRLIKRVYPIDSGLLLPSAMLTVHTLFESYCTKVEHGTMERTPLDVWSYVERHCELQATTSPLYFYCKKTLSNGRELMQKLELYLDAKSPADDSIQVDKDKVYEEEETALPPYNRKMVRKDQVEQLLAWNYTCRAINKARKSIEARLPVIIPAGYDHKHNNPRHITDNVDAGDNVAHRIALFLSNDMIVLCNTGNRIESPIIIAKQVTPDSKREPTQAERDSHWGRILMMLVSAVSVNDPARYEPKLPWHTLSLNCLPLTNSSYDCFTLTNGALLLANGQQFLDLVLEPSRGIENDVLKWLTFKYQILDYLLRKPMDVDGAFASVDTRYLKVANGTVKQWRLKGSTNVDQYDEGKWVDVTPTSAPPSLTFDETHRVIINKPDQITGSCTIMSILNMIEAVRVWKLYEAEPRIESIRTKEFLTLGEFQRHVLNSLVVIPRTDIMHSDEDNNDLEILRMIAVEYSDEIHVSVVGADGKILSERPTIRDYLMQSKEPRSYRIPSSAKLAYNIKYSAADNDHPEYSFLGRFDDDKVPILDFVHQRLQELSGLDHAESPITAYNNQKYLTFYDNLFRIERRTNVCRDIKEVMDVCDLSIEFIQKNVANSPSWRHTHYLNLLMGILTKFCQLSSIRSPGLLDDLNGLFLFFEQANSMIGATTVPILNIDVFVMAISTHIGFWWPPITSARNVPLKRVTERIISITKDKTMLYNVTDIATLYRALQAWPEHLCFINTLRLIYILAANHKIEQYDSLKDRSIKTGSYLWLPVASRKLHCQTNNGKLLGWVMMQTTEDLPIDEFLPVPTEKANTWEFVHNPTSSVLPSDRTGTVVLDGAQIRYEQKQNDEMLALLTSERMLTKAVMASEISTLHFCAILAHNAFSYLASNVDQRNMVIRIMKTATQHKDTIAGLALDLIIMGLTMFSPEDVDEAVVNSALFRMKAYFKTHAQLDVHRYDPRRITQSLLAELMHGLWRVATAHAERSRVLAGHLAALTRAHLFHHLPTNRKNETALSLTSGYFTDKGVESTHNMAFQAHMDLASGAMLIPVDSSHSSWLRIVFNGVVLNTRRLLESSHFIYRIHDILTEISSNGVSLIYRPATNRICMQPHYYDHFLWIYDLESERMLVRDTKTNNDYVLLSDADPRLSAYWGWCNYFHANSTMFTYPVERDGTIYLLVAYNLNMKAYNDHHNTFFAPQTDTRETGVHILPLSDPCVLRPPFDVNVLQTVVRVLALSGNMFAFRVAYNAFYDEKMRNPSAYQGGPTDAWDVVDAFNSQRSLTINARLKGLYRREEDFEGAYGMYPSESKEIITLLGTLHTRIMTQTSTSAQFKSLAAQFKALLSRITAARLSIQKIDPDDIGVHKAYFAQGDFHLLLLHMELVCSACIACINAISPLKATDPTRRRYTKYITGVRRGLYDSKVRTPKYVYLFEVVRSVLVQEQQMHIFTEMKNQIARDPQSPVPMRLYEMLMGSGKTDILIPLLCFGLAIEGNHTQVLVVQPAHLVQETSVTISELFRNSGLSKYDLSLQDSITTEYRTVYPDKCHIMVQTDSVTKASVRQRLDRRRVAMIIDEIDSVMRPSTSALNFPDIKLSHPLETKKDIDAAAPAFRNAYIDVVISLVLGSEALYKERTQAAVDEKRTDVQYLDLSVLENFQKVLQQASASGDLVRLLGPYSGEVIDKLAASFRAIARLTYNVNYGLPEAHQVKNPFKAKPFIAQGVPSQSSDFSKYDVLAVFTIYAYLIHGLRGDDFERMHKELSREIREMGVSIVAKNDHKRALIDAIQMYSVNQLVKEQQFNVSLISAYLKAIVFPLDISTYAEQRTITAYHLLYSKFTHAQAAFTGTLNVILPVNTEKAQTYTEEVPDEDGRERIAKALRVSVKQPVRAPTPTTIVQYAIEKKLFTIVDAFAFFNVKELTSGNKKGTATVELIDAYMSREHPGLFKGVVFFNKENKAVVFSTKTKLVEDLGLHRPEVSAPGEYFFYFDEAHTIGSNLKLPNVNGLLLVNNDTLSAKAAQAAYRMRNLDEGQNIFMMLISDTDYQDYKEGELYKYLERNQAKAAEHETVLGATQNMRVLFDYARQEEYATAPPTVTIANNYLLEDEKKLKATMQALIDKSSYSAQWKMLQLRTESKDGTLIEEVETHTSVAAENAQEQQTGQEKARQLNTDIEEEMFAADLEHCIPRVEIVRNVQLSEYFSDSNDLFATLPLWPGFEVALSPAINAIFQNPAGIIAPTEYSTRINAKRVWGLRPAKMRGCSPMDLFEDNKDYIKFKTITAIKAITQFVCILFRTAARSLRAIVTSIDEWQRILELDIAKETKAKAFIVIDATGSIIKANSSLDLENHPDVRLFRVIFRSLCGPSLSLRNNLEFLMRIEKVQLISQMTERRPNLWYLAAAFLGSYRQYLKTAGQSQLYEMLYKSAPPSEYAPRERAHIRQLLHITEQDEKAIVDAPMQSLFSLQFNSKTAARAVEAAQLHLTLTELLSGQALVLNYEERKVFVDEDEDVVMIDQDMTDSLPGPVAMDTEEPLPQSTSEITIFPADHQFFETVIQQVRKVKLSSFLEVFG